MAHPNVLPLFFWCEMAIGTRMMRMIKHPYNQLAIVGSVARDTTILNI